MLTLPPAVVVRLDPLVTVASIVSKVPLTERLPPTLVPLPLEPPIAAAAILPANDGEVLPIALIGPFSVDSACRLIPSAPACTVELSIEASTTSAIWFQPSAIP